MSAMRLVVFGSSGRCGRLLAQGALERGHTVTALIGATEEPGPLRGRVHAVPGDVRDGGAVSDAVDGQEAVLVALADARGGGRATTAQGTLNVIRSMQRYGVRRLVVLSAAGVQAGHDANLPWFHERLVKPLFLGSRHAELRRVETSVRQSELEWTLVRAASLVDVPARGGYRSGPGFRCQAAPGSAVPTSPLSCSTSSSAATTWATRWRSPTESAARALTRSPPAQLEAQRRLELRELKAEATLGEARRDGVLAGQEHLLAHTAQAQQHRRPRSRQHRGTA